VAIDAVTVQAARDGYVASIGLGWLRFFGQRSATHRPLWDPQRKSG
jgi:hypothetical protein